jgi:hypothetical protein
LENARASPLADLYNKARLAYPDTAMATRVVNDVLGFHAYLISIGKTDDADRFLLRASDDLDEEAKCKSRSRREKLLRFTVVESKNIGVAALAVILATIALAHFGVHL